MCEARQGDASFEARLTVSYVIKRDGTVSDVAIPEADRYNPVLEGCVKEVVGTFAFYPGSAAIVVNAPLVFRKDAPAG